MTALMHQKGFFIILSPTIGNISATASKGIYNQDNDGNVMLLEFYLINHTRQCYATVKGFAIKGHLLQDTIPCKDIREGGKGA